MAFISCQLAVGSWRRILTLAFAFALAFA